MGILPAQLFSKWGFELQGADPAVGWVYYLHSYSLNGGSSYKELSQHQIKLPSGSLFQSNVLVANFTSSTSPTDFYFALNPFPTAPTGGGVLLPLRILAKWTFQNVRQRLFPQVTSSPTFNHAQLFWPFITR